MNPLLKNKRIPSQTFRIPSRGLFYKNGELDGEVSDGEILINPMTTQDDIYMKTPDMLYQGTAVTTVLSRCCPQILKPAELLTIDVDYILTCLRKISYGAYITITFNHGCKDNAEDHEYNISTDHLLTNTKELTNEFHEKYNLTISSGELVKLKPPTFGELLKLNQIRTDTMKVEEMIDHTFNAYTFLIESVDGCVDKEHILEWLKNTNIGVLDEIVNHIEVISDWGTDFTHKIKCKDCGETIDLPMPVNPVTFFTLPSNQKTKKK